MIYLLNANMIDSTASNMICSSATNVVVCFGQCYCCEAAEKCRDVTTGTDQLSSFQGNVTVGLSLCHIPPRNVHVVILSKPACGRVEWISQPACQRERHRNITTFKTVSFRRSVAIGGNPLLRSKTAFIQQNHFRRWKWFFPPLFIVIAKSDDEPFTACSPSFHRQAVWFICTVRYKRKEDEP